MIIECPYCECNVDGEVLAQHESQASDDPFPYRASLLRCPVCDGALLATQELFQTGPRRHEWSRPTRSWPLPEQYSDWNLPNSVRRPLVEARQCYRAKAYAACAVMCGTVLEAICVEHGTKDKLLAGCLRELRDREVIDNRIFAWGEALRQHRNIGAHASPETISREDARDLLDFANAICNYVFVLTNKFEAFIKRKEGSDIQ